jgi:hypothetical protein
VHDLNGGIPPSGLFLTLQLPDDALTVSEDGRRATLRVEDLPVIDSFQALGPNTIPASVSFEVVWSARGEALERGSTSPNGPTDPAALSGRSSQRLQPAPSRSASWASASPPGASTKDTYAQIGSERNGVHLARE